MISLTLLMIAVAYLFGSLSSAVVISQLFGLPDPRTAGSKNPGATNVYRLGGRVPALFVLVMDILKGTIPVYGSYFLGIEPIMLGVIAIFACLGHIFPLYFGFKGGKAVATAFGAMLPIGLDLAGLLILSWVVVVFLTGYSSMGALIAVSLAPLFTFLIKPLYTVPVAMLSLLIILRHKDNIARLLAGNESKVWDKGKVKE
ncbi:MAG: glycerol-3-phosphate 1-O-acyltransferase PlsY [Alteromonas macleodii]|jgi:glycerol-3-phosphate acyltransferase PlsY|uniref:glycerol-3-phosphate 1-O-acyltransferase PlsY n=1 Tax=Alteromonas TaxID=226 RepID=UPI001280D718|nr:glycerol-3-phosphate 1-O-acyltransferase PlsY [Alteromonas macleodii]MCG8497471.1 glycerol-3-phosphate 1-O-acyltransferase PlsY [Enterobacterales bacterium]MDM7963537.1 glycerol-3-phosphate 1-O-acyltransferase PlsY [Alteromonas macleodii]MDM8171979.1 glycerol-3-phosphate 1-O-acyltransferase PlsY [Alteromonas macleodii]CAI3934727.1 acyl-phosphate glycerol-3-phosphate acyltransferase [Alteromonas macleodii]VTP52639.1 acyl-phosphate glycerol-3-phosphate acyltransferase [Alteromonas macleodii]|tara:strand:+ start:168 stop:770 length:603 start_codon:yes stop_codon:yes gene_type:complete